MAGFWVVALHHERPGMGELVLRCLAGPLPAPSTDLVRCTVATWSIGRDAPGYSVVDGEAWLREAVRLAEEIGDTEALAQAEFAFGDVLAGWGRSDEADALLRSSDERFAALGMWSGCAWVAMRFAFEEMARGDFPAARARLELARSRLEGSPARRRCSARRTHYDERWANPVTTWPPSPRPCKQDCGIWRGRLGVLVFLFWPLSATRPRRSPRGDRPGVRLVGVQVPVESSVMAIDPCPRIR